MKTIDKNGTVIVSGVAIAIPKGQTPLWVTYRKGNVTYRATLPATMTPSTLQCAMLTKGVGLSSIERIVRI